MNEQQAAALASDITETWQLTASRRIWIESLTPMRDHDAARTAYATLRRNHTGRDMSIGQFTDEYRKHRPLTALPTADGCRICLGDGWITSSYEHRGHTYSGVTACTCPLGRANERTHTAVTRSRDDA